MLYNSLSNVFIKIDEIDLLSLLQQVQAANSDSVLSNYPDLKKDLVKAKIIVESDEQEILRIKYLQRIIRHDKHVIPLTVLPTLSCNFKCPYCFEKKGKIERMNKTAISGIVKLVKTIADENTRKTLVNLTWMGGEPLMNFNDMTILTTKLQETNVNLQAKIITNGYLLTKNVIEQMPAMNVYLTQVTIDGLKEQHNKTRMHVKDTNSFDKIIENLFISPGFIEDIKGDKKGSVKCEFDTTAIKDFYKEMFLRKVTNYSVYPRNIVNECAVRSPNSFSIGPKGELYSCWENIGYKEHIIGQVDKDGKVFITKELEYLRYMLCADYLDDPKCLKCFFFPICSGGCPEKRIRNEFCGANFDNCSMHKKHLEELLDFHYYKKYKQ
ncbi:MAG: SPASM domain-containing protein [Bacteroidales bacterium]|jgi:uncharacterized protein|nr:SPASM domain-containing protein [Bacteroidales bacterium]